VVERFPFDPSHEPKSAGQLGDISRESSSTSNRRERRI